MRALRIEADDNVAVVVQDTKSGDALQVGDGTVTAAQDIPTGHKIAVAPIAKGEYVRKYGAPIGKAGCDIAPGDYVHSHNLEDVTGQLCKEYAAQYRAKGGKQHG